MAETIRIEIPIEVLDKTNPGLSSAISSLDKAESKVSKFDEKAEKTRKSLSDWAKEKYEVALEALDKVSPLLKTVKDGLHNLGGKAWSVTMKAVDLVTAPVKGIIDLFKNPIFQVGAVMGVSFGLKDTIDTFSSFEATMSKVKAISGATAGEMEALTEKAKVMGADTKFSATESGEAFTYMAMAGWDAGQMLDGISGIMSLSAADGLDLATTSDIVTDAITAFGMKASDSAHFADVLATASSSANTNVSMLGESFKYVAPVAGAMKYSVEDISLALGLMANSSVKGSMAGTALKTSIANLAAPTDKMSEAMEQYGISLTDSNGEMKSFRGVMGDIRSGLGQLSEAEQTAAASTIFGKEAMAGMLAIVNASEEDYQKLAEAIDGADGAADSMAATMQDNLAGTFEQLGGAVETVQLTLGERLKPYLLDLAQWLESKMPAIEDLINRTMDNIDTKVSELKGKIKEFTGTEEWEQADLFGKAKIAWDELIGNPFKEWWGSAGKAMFANAAADIGNGLGTAISTGILGLLGIDVTSALDDGASIGANFTKGFAAGFDGEAVKEAFTNTLKGILSSATGIFGEDAGIGNWLSALLVGKTALSLGGGLFKGIGLGKTLMTGSSGGGGLISLLGSALGSAGTGTGILGFGANTAINLGAGNLAGGASLSAGALSGLGLGAVAGGVVAGGTLISGAMDLYKGNKSDNIEEAQAYNKSGAKKIGGVAAGAAIGTMIAPGIGTLIGAGIGGAVGYFSGKKDVEEYQAAAEEAAKQEAEAARQLALQQEQAKYKSQELKDALKEVSEANMTPEQFEALKQKVIRADIDKHFGKIALSLKEVKTLAESIVFKEGTESLNKFLEASAQAEDSLANYQDTVSQVEKLNWKATLGNLTVEETDSYVATVNQMVSNAQTYLNDQQYAVHAALDVFFEPERAQTFKDNSSEMYAGFQQQIDELSADLNAKMTIYLEDGVLTMDEAAEIENLQNQINSITGKFAQAQQEAQLESIKIRFNGAALDYDTFASFQSELGTYFNEKLEASNEALDLGILDIKLQLENELIDPVQYLVAKQQLENEWRENVSGAKLEMESVQINSIVDVFGSELENILPEIEGTTAQKLTTALNNALTDPELDPASWNLPENLGIAVESLGLEGLDEVAQTEIATIMAAVAQSIPKNLNEQLAEVPIDFSVLGPVSDSYMEQVSSLLGETDISPAIADAILSMDQSGIQAAIASSVTSTGSAIDTAYSAGFNTTTDVNITANYKLANPSATIQFSGGGSGTATVQASVFGMRANGGFTDGAELSWIGEDGPEVVIPLGGKRRNRGLDLLYDTMDIFGIPRYANGGFVGGLKPSNSVTNSSSINYLTDLYKTQPGINHEYSEEDSESDSGSGWSSDIKQSSGVASGPITVNVSMNPSFNIDGGTGSEDTILGVLKSHIREMADDIGDEIAAKLEKIFSNMPVEGA